MCNRSRSLILPSSWFLLLFTFVLGDVPPPWIECSNTPSGSTINPIDSHHILSRLPALQLSPYHVQHSDKLILSLPLLAHPYHVPARFTYRTCVADFIIWTAEEFLDHWLAEEPLNGEEMAFYFWPEARKQGTAVIEGCLVKGRRPGAGYGTIYVPRSSDDIAEYFYGISIKASSNETSQPRRAYPNWHLYNV